MHLIYQSYTQQRRFQNFTCPQCILHHEHLINPLYCCLQKTCLTLAIHNNIQQKKKKQKRYTKHLKERSRFKLSRGYQSPLLLTRLFSILCSLCCCPLGPSQDILGNLIKRNLEAACGIRWTLYNTKRNVFVVLEKSQIYPFLRLKSFQPYTVKKPQIHTLLPEKFPNQDRKSVCQ